MLSQPGSVRALVVSLLLPRRLRQRKDTGGAGPCSRAPAWRQAWPGLLAPSEASSHSMSELKQGSSLYPSVPVLLCGPWGNIWSLELTVAYLMGPEVGLIRREVLTGPFMLSQQMI